MINIRIDLTGQRFGRLAVIKEVPKRGKERDYLCKCDCGNETIVRQGSLRSGNTTSCGCYRDERVSETQRRDHTGVRYGKLVAIRRIGQSEKTGESTTPLWLCECDCGNKKTVRSTNLLSGHTKSCGCLSGKPNWEGSGTSDPVAVTKDEIVDKMRSFYKENGKRISLDGLGKIFNCSRQTIRNRLDNESVKDIWKRIELEVK